MLVVWFPGDVDIHANMPYKLEIVGAPSLQVLLILRTEKADGTFNDKQISNILKLPLPAENN